MDALIYFIITIGILVFVHEFGHFAAAKLSKMRVDVFALGFGYRLLGWNKLTGFSFGNLPKDWDGQGNTDYRLSILPLGGYVKIAGMIDESMDKDFIDKEPQPYEFRSKSTPKKLFVISAGVLMNLLLAFAIFWGSNLFYGKQQTKTTTIGFVESGSPADSAGFVSGDKILKVNGKPIKYWEDVRTEVFINSLGKDVTFDLLRNGKNEILNVKRAAIPQDETKGLFLAPVGLKPVVSDVLKNSRADSAGLKPNDILLTINGTDLASVQQTIAIISAAVEEEIAISVLRGTDTVALAAVPNKDGKIGIALGGYAYLGESERITFGFFESFSLGAQDILRTTSLTFVMVKRVVTGDIEFKQAFGGPIKIAQFAARSADSGLMNFLMFLGLLSLSLAIINILPIPALDGGHIVIIAIEGIMRRELPVKVKLVIQNTGFILLLLLMAFIIYNDVISL
ncbi:MAG TPA: RIP metalloprotease RseP [Ignavibacteriaceae bacterium]|nr:RIP metalloprotease RseP [Ignavibacteriaceae bacterium]